MLLRTKVAVGSVVPEDDELLDSRLTLSVAFDGSESISEARDAARRFMIELQVVHGVPVSDRALGMVELVVSELVTNAYKFAPGPCLLDVKLVDGALEVGVWDTDPTLPTASPADPGRAGRHGLEIVMVVCRSVEMRREPVGKRVVATIALGDDPESTLPAA
ncbi:ATP-binding protein [Streptomyces afghaniensis]|uniref:ATP-binding protein n=1 Tax=Streptomyces afghaniensis TaxID=66865 RepID=UPI00379AE44B